MKVTLVKKNDKIISIGAGKYCFAVENENVIIHSDALRTSDYIDAYNLCRWALKNNLWDEI